MSPRIAIVAIDGQGQETERYVSLLEDCGVALPFAEKVLLTSTGEGRSGDVQLVRIPELDYFAYSRFCVETLTEYIDADHALMVQLDGFILDPLRWEPGFLDYDYIGAPWRAGFK